MYVTYKQHMNLRIILWYEFLTLCFELFCALDTSVVPPLIYALMGSSREIAIGPVAVVSMLLSSMIQPVVDVAADPIAYRKLVFTVTFFAGLFQSIFGLFRYVLCLSKWLSSLTNYSYWYIYSAGWGFWWIFFHMLPLLDLWLVQPLLLAFSNWRDYLASVISPPKLMWSLSWDLFLHHFKIR